MWVLLRELVALEGTYARRLFTPGIGRHLAFRSATEPFDTGSPAGRMMVQMLGVFAEFERATIIDRVIAGMERKAARGGWCGGRDPFGYRLVKGEGRLVVDETEAPLVGSSSTAT